jgi:23S rRNA (cytosine1962-C5)-methyltransferase
MIMSSNDPSASQHDPAIQPAHADPMAAECAEVVIRHRRAQPFFGRHPWVFAGAIENVRGAGDEAPAPGSIVRVISHEKRFIAWGLYNPNSRIVVRLYSWNESRPLTAAFWKQRIQEAVSSRRTLFDLTSSSIGCRLVFSESDGLSGLVADFYGGFLLVQFTSLALFEHREAIVSALQEEIRPRGIWLRTEKGMREAEGLEAVDGLLSGAEPPRPLFIEEHGVAYGVDVQQGQKTGCYLDQRDNRLAASRFLKGARVLDAFCFSGGFGITALKIGSAASVVGVDSSESALAMAQANAELNGVAAHCQWKNADVRAAIEEMAEQGTVFDAVILDPPKMARTRGGTDRAIHGYVRLNELALSVLRPGGILVTCSCSGLITRDEFQEMLAEVARHSGREIQILEMHGQPADHPVRVTCPETEYLKVCICRVG